MSKSTRRGPVRRPSVQPGRKPPARAHPARTPAVNRSVSDLLARVRTDPRWILLVLRGYLGFTFVYAGLSKIGGRSFLDSSSPTSMHATLLAVRTHSPIGALLGPVEHHAFAFGLLIAFAETAVGTGMLLGLFARVAAVGGMFISLTLFLTVSWNATPWYTGADIVYLFAFTPTVLGGAGPISADEWLTRRLAADDAPGARATDVSRRVIVAGVATLGSLVAIGAASLVRRASSTGSPAGVAGGNTTSGAGTSTATRGAPPSTGQPSTSAAAAGPALVAAGKVPVGGAVQASDPNTGDPIYVLQLQPGSFTALDAICPHQGCTVSFISKTAGFVCPCHLSTFDPSGAVTQGPAPTGLTKIPVARSGNDIVLA